MRPCSRDTNSRLQSSNADSDGRAFRFPRELISIVYLWILALGYAALAGLRTVAEPDLGWQLATGRWILQHHSIPSTDILSYTTTGHPWLYPVASQLILYCAYKVGGYSLLSWMCMTVCVLSVALMLKRDLMTIVLTTVAVPLVAARSVARAEMFSTLLFAVVLVIVWRHYRTGNGPLWALPGIMCLWVNLHLGFIAGLALCIAYVLLELGEQRFRPGAHESQQRLRSAVPWLFAAALATIANPWGLRVYLTAPIQGALQSQASFVTEIRAIPFTLERMATVFAWRRPESALWWLLIAAVVAGTAAIVQRRFMEAVLLLSVAYLGLHVWRYEAMFACFVAVVGGSVLSDSYHAIAKKRTHEIAIGVVLMISISTLVGVRSWDVVSNRGYLGNVSEYGLFGPGEASWFPEGAASWILDNQPPGNVFNEYNTGGLVAWKLQPRYPDYLDGRGISGPLFWHGASLLWKRLDGPEWEQEARSRNIYTIVVSLDHEFGVNFDLAAFCDSSAWRLAYVDPSAAVFLRVSDETADLVNRRALDCKRVQFRSPPQGDGARALAERFNYYLNAASALNMLGRSGDALEAIEQAEAIAPYNPYLHYAKAVAQENENQLASAEDEYRACLKLDHLDAASLALGRLYRSQQRFAEAAEVLDRASQWSLRPHQLYLELGATQLATGLPAEALKAFGHAEKSSPFVGDAALYGTAFDAQLAEGRGRAYWKMGDLATATEFLQKATNLTPDNLRRRLILASLYDTRGMSAEAAAARKGAVPSSSPNLE